MTIHKNVYFFFLFCLAVSLVLLYVIIRPFLPTLILAAIFAFIFHPVYRKLMGWTKNHAGISALISTVIAVIVLILPVSLLGTLILKEATDVYRQLANGNNQGLVNFVQDFLTQMRAVVTVPISFQPDINQLIRQGLGFLVTNVGAIFSSFANLLVNTLVFLIAFYFFLKDGVKLKQYLIKLSPLNDKDDERIVTKLKQSVTATFKGSLTIGLIQGTLTGIGFAIFGVPNPVLWGSMAAIAALIPGVGTSLVLIPGMIYLFLTHGMFGGMGLLLWGVLAVGLIDNVLAPKLIGDGMELHPLAVFLSVLGGLAFFGPLGFILGPMAFSVCLTLIDIYFSFRTQNGS